MITHTQMKEFPEGTVNFSAHKRAVKNISEHAMQKKLWDKIFSDLSFYMDSNTNFDMNILRKKFRRKYYLTKK